MTGFEKPQSLFSRLRYHSWWLMAAWTGCLAASLLWNLHEEKKKIHEVARNTAQVTFENDVLYRKWTAMQGGVYVPVSEVTPPNPYLNVPERDVSTTSGAALTLVNPAYMARQVNELATDIHGSRGHITSLRPLRPENRPDAWEAEALAAFEKGVHEVSSISRIDGEEYLRLMRPFVAEKACLKCHASQGYKEGDIRGGISVSIATAPLWAIETPHIVGMSAVHFVLWALGVTGIVISKKRLEWQIHAREQADAALRRTAEDLARSNKELEHFAYVAGHDLQEPLRTVAGFAGMLKTRYQGKLDASADEYIGFVVDGALRMKQLLDDLLAYSRADRRGYELRRIDTGECLAAALANLKVALAESEAVVSYDGLPSVEADPTQLAQVFQNLIGNAVKFRRKGVPCEIQIGARRDTDCWVFSVKDNGIGIAPEHRDRVFAIFQRLHARSEYTGTGVGLAICKKIVERHGGRIWVESQLGEGSIFYFTIAPQAEVLS